MQTFVLNPEDRGGMFLQILSADIPDYTVSLIRRPQYESLKPWQPRLLVHLFGWFTLDIGFLHLVLYKQFRITANKILVETVAHIYPCQQGAPKPPSYSRWVQNVGVYWTVAIRQQVNDDGLRYTTTGLHCRYGRERIQSPSLHHFVFVYN
jgi:hypothetical protein